MYSFAICPVSIVPVRANPSEKSEMVTQILFGEAVEILWQEGNWHKIRCCWDGCEGWVDAKQILPLTASEWEDYSSSHAYCIEIMHPALCDAYSLPLTLGAVLPAFDGIRTRLKDVYFNFSGQIVFQERLSASDTLVLKMARKYLYTPQLWGGRSPFGIDSAGLVQMTFRLAAGIFLPRDALQQSNLGKTIDFIDQTRAGDLVFFENGQSRVSHVGILMGDEKVIHTFGQVRIDSIDHYGIFNATLNKYTHKLRIIKRLLPDKINSSMAINISENTEIPMIAINNKNQTSLF